MMCVMEPQDWTRLGAALAAARDSHQLTQEQAASDLSISRSTVQAIEHGRTFKKVTPTIRAYARLLGWTDDSPERVLAGGEPVMREPRSDDAQAAENIAGAGARLPRDLSLSVLQSLQEGPLLDTEIVRVTTPDGREVRATIVVRGESDATPEELHQALIAWRERGLR
jgi:transcriptional regulator with XRE-family HTH domain